jgi:hypothetical protein
VPDGPAVSPREVCREERGPARRRSDLPRPLRKALLFWLPSNAGQESNPIGTGIRPTDRPVTEPVSATSIHSFVISSLRALHATLALSPYCPFLGPEKNCQYLNEKLSTRASKRTYVSYQNHDLQDCKQHISTLVQLATSQLSSYSPRHCTGLIARRTSTPFFVRGTKHARKPGIMVDESG